MISKDKIMKRIALKTAAVSLAVMVSACSSCIKSPDLDVAPMAQEANSIVRESQITSKNTDDLKEKYAFFDTDTVTFDYNSAALDAGDQEELQKIAKFIKKNDVKSVTVEGHCDERGTREYNLSLGDRRAVSIKKYLVSLGVDAKRITTVSYGKERPANKAHTEAAWAENRRGVVVLN